MKEKFRKDRQVIEDLKKDLKLAKDEVIKRDDNYNKLMKKFIEAYKLIDDIEEEVYRANRSTHVHWVGTSELEDFVKENKDLIKEP